MTKDDIVLPLSDMQREYFFSGLAAALLTSRHAGYAKETDSYQNKAQNWIESVMLFFADKPVTQERIKDAVDAVQVDGLNKLYLASAVQSAYDDARQRPTTHVEATLRRKAAIIEH